MPKKIRVCSGPNCRRRGSENIMKTLREHTGEIIGSETEPIDLDFCGCTSYCEFGPNVVVDDHKILHQSQAKTIIERLNRNEGEELKPVNPAELDRILNEF